MDIYQEQELTKERQHKRATQALLDDADFKAVFASAEGRRFVRRMLGECGVFRTSFNPDATTMAYHEGKRAIGLWLTALFDGHPEAYIQLLQEKTNENY